MEQGLAGRTKLNGADYVVALYNLFMATVWAQHMTDWRYAPWIFAAHVAGAFMPALLARLPIKPVTGLNALRHLYPLIWLMPFWTELDFVRQFAIGTFDGPIAALDRGVFGLHLHEVWLPRMPYVWFSELMFLSYGAYYLLIVGPPLVLALRKHWVAVDDVALRLMVGYVGCYVVYVMFPVDGPHFLAERFVGPHTEGTFYRIVETLQRTGDSQGAAFPSSHVVGAVTIAFLGWRWFPRWVGAVLTLEALGIALATVYTQNHYAIDSLAGVLFALGLQAVAVPSIQRMVSERLPGRARRPVAPAAGGVFTSR